MITALASVIDSEDPEEIDRIISEGIPDPIGTFYRFSLANSELRRTALTNGGNGRSEVAETA
jgi:F420-non-reducing hydrogenase small subunit